MIKIISLWHGLAWVRAPGELRPLELCYFLTAFLQCFERRSDGCRPDERHGVADMFTPPSPSLRLWLCAIRSRPHPSSPEPPLSAAAAALTGCSPFFAFARSRWRVHAQASRRAPRLHFVLREVSLLGHTAQSHMCTHPHVWGRFCLLLCSYFL